MTKKIKTRRLIASLFLILLLVLSGSGAVYSWIIGDITPDVKGEFSIGSASGLILSLGQDDGIIADLNDYYALTSSELQLSECSSIDAETIYARDYSQYFEDASENEIIVLKAASQLVKTETGVEGEYFEETFNLRLTYSDSDDFYIYFMNGYLDGSPYISGFSQGANSTITADGLKALRLGLYVDGIKDGLGDYDSDYYNSNLFDSVNDEPKYAIFCNDYEANPIAVNTVGSIKLPITTPKTSSNICQNVGGTMYGSTGTPTLLKFSDYALNNGESNVDLSGTSLPAGTNYLFKLSDAYSSVTITVRIWLEGLSEYCTDGKITTDDGVNLDLYFVAYHLTGSN